ncbi:MAG: MBL fold metallo-hydrolase [Clostridia bacterium]|nr:MBL fold metallo-hydrolase [Clostridia bacterium]MDE7328435.1 MBL fold metallo-hydrolase [Clostridia bacterium]
MKFCNLASGSKGNCTIISAGGVSLMIDDGLNIRDLEQRAMAANIDLSKINAILVTHEHSDHVKGLSALVKKYSIPIYCHDESAKYLDARAAAYVNRRNMDLPFELGEIEITPFRLPHDSAYNLGYRFSDGKASVAIATDLGCVNESILNYFIGCNLVMLESNHDIDMLRSGNYPFALKQRILSKNGHLSNDECAQTIATLAASGTKRFVLAHLSQDNNTPELAFEMTARALETAGFSEGRDVFVETALQYRATAKIILD